MRTTQQSFDLTSRPWIQVRTHDGATEEVGLVELLTNPQAYTRIVAELPTIAFAQLRLILAVVYDALGGPATEEDWRALRAGPVPAQAFADYLGAHRGKLDLFDPVAPFFQTADLEPTNPAVGIKHLGALVADVAPKGHFASRAGSALRCMSPAEAARWLVHAQAYDVAGIHTGIVGDPRTKSGKTVGPTGAALAWCGYLGGVTIEGPDLWSTILANLIPLGEDLLGCTPQDRPAWVGAPSRPGPAPDLHERPYGPRDLFTWQSRRIRLMNDGHNVTGVVIGYGDPLTPANRVRQEPMTAWRRDGAPTRKRSATDTWVPVRPRLGREPWRGLAAQLPATATGAGDAYYTAPAVVQWAGRVLGPGARIAVRVTGLTYDDKNAVVTGVIDDHLSIARELLDAKNPDLPAAVCDVIARTERGVYALGRLAAGIVAASGQGTGKGAAKDGASARAAERAYADLDHHLRAWIAALTPATDLAEAVGAWNARARSVILSHSVRLVENAPGTAWKTRTGGVENVAVLERQFLGALDAAVPR